MDLWDAFFVWIDSIPAVIWSGAIGALLASGMSYVGIRSANNSSYKRLRDQHVHDKLEADKQRSHDAIQKEEDRKAAIRREVYTKAVEETHAALGAIGGFPFKPLDFSGNTDSDALQVFLKANSKIWLVAESEAAHLSRDLANKMSEVYLLALASAFPLRLALDPVWELNKKLIHAESEVLRKSVKLADLAEQGADANVIEAVQKAWKEANDLVDAIKRHRAHMREALAPQQLAYSRKLIAEMEPLQKTMVQLISSLRKEIHLSPDEAEFMQQQLDMRKNVLALFERLFGPAPA
ncbi:hypothetical protein SAMN04515617_11911 [Collimonas sp. OK242]|uniref:hypothetical protein n=1 Tax=Collimonas sp. OK242 TaxID=1798195 RepID=UPI00089BF2EF|nr:hypothetical protein [Collimonas sp. OK242]SDY67600.1 hypothetical protein SAMN04515617_11911 [Collimonas sp. OK242]